MKYILLDKQKEFAIENYNYFLTKLILKILFTFLKISLILIINQIFNKVIFNVICILYVILSIHIMCYNIKKYYYILKDIRNTLNIDDSYIVIDFKNNKIKRVFGYGK